MGRVSPMDDPTSQRLLLFTSNTNKFSWLSYWSKKWTSILYKWSSLRFFFKVIKWILKFVQSKCVDILNYPTFFSRYIHMGTRAGYVNLPSLSLSLSLSLTHTHTHKQVLIEQSLLFLSPFTHFILAYQFKS